MLSYGRLYKHFGCKLYKGEGLIKNSVQFKIHRIPHSLYAYRAIIHKSLHNFYELVILYYIIHLHIQMHTTTTDHHHTVQVARVQVQYLHQWLNEKAPLAQVAAADNHHLCKWNVYTS